MARQEQDREDLLREATALVQRIELQIAGHTEPVIIGFRRDGSGSIYMGGDPVFQFNSRNELRRGFFAGRLIKAEEGRLVSLERQRTAEETQLWRSDLSPAQAAAFMASLQTNLRLLRQAIQGGQYQVVGQVSPAGDLLPKVAEWLDLLGENVPIAQVPNAR